MKCLHWSSRNIVRRAISVVAHLFKPARNSIYKATDLSRATLATCLRRASAERSQKPSPDILLRRLKQVDERELEQTLERENRKLLRRLKLPRRPLIALDYRTLPYYGADRPELVSSSELPGTTRGVRFAMLSVVESKRTLTLRACQVTPFDTHIGVLQRMLAGLPLRPSLLLLDRGFYAVEVVLALTSMGIHFIMPAPRTTGIKRLIESFERGEVPACTEYEMHGRGGRAKVRLMFLRRRTDDGWLTFAFISDLPLDPAVAAVLYSCRWRIEANNRELKKFMARTTSRDMKLRRIYYSLAALLYNLWIVLRQAAGMFRSYEFKQALIVELEFSFVAWTAEHPPPL